MERSPSAKQIKTDSSATTRCDTYVFFAQPADETAFISCGTAGKYNCKNSGNSEEQHRWLQHNCVVQTAVTATFGRLTIKSSPRRFKSSGMLRHVEWQLPTFRGIV